MLIRKTMYIAMLLPQPQFPSRKYSPVSASNIYCNIATTQTPQASSAVRLALILSKYRIATLSGNTIDSSNEAGIFGLYILQTANGAMVKGLDAPERK